MSSKQFALEFLMSQAWALDGNTLDVMSEIARRSHGAESLEGALSESGFQALESRGGGKFGDTMTMRPGGVALLPVNGVVSRYATMFSAICGGTSTQILARDFNAALNDPSVKSIVLNIDSPGGDANGIHEIAEMIYQARGKKKVVAYVGGTGCSAAYWIASAADELVLDATARIGSIGTVLTMRRRKVKDDDEFEEIEIVSSQSPNKRLDPASKEGRKAYQTELDELADVFVDRVARNMSVDRETVLSEFGQGGVLVGESAVKAGMANRLGSLESVIDELAKGKYSVSSNKTSSVDGGGVTFSFPTGEEMSAADLVSSLEASRPDVIKAIKGPVPVMAIDAASEIVVACKSAGVPELAASLLSDGLTKAEANERLKMAGKLKDTLGAAGLGSSFSVLFESASDPVAMVGKAIHETRASRDESSDSSNHTTGAADKEAVVINATDIYAKRNAK
jgi:ClpP class serine protease